MTANLFAVGTSSTALSQVASVPFGEFFVTNKKGGRLVSLPPFDISCCFLVGWLPLAFVAASVFVFLVVVFLPSRLYLYHFSLRGGEIPIFLVA